MGQGQLPVDGDGVMEGLQQWPAVVHHSDDAVAQALVVVDEIEVVPPTGQDLAGPEAEGPRFGEAGRAHHPELQGIEAGVELAELGDPERVGLAVEVEAGNRGEANPVVHFGPRLAGEHLDGVAEGGEFPGQVAGIDPLATAAGVAPIHQKGDPQAPGGRGLWGDPLGHRRGQGRPFHLVPSEPETRHSSPRSRCT